MQIDHFTHVPGPVNHYRSEIDYNTAYTTGMALAQFVIINDELMNKYSYMVP